MAIHVLYIDECPNWQEAGSRIRQALDTLGHDETPVEYVRIRTPAEAAAWVFAGSPTILVDGQDLFPSGGRTHDLACRVYSTDEGLAGAPTCSQIEEALRRRLGGR